MSGLREINPTNISRMHILIETLLRVSRVKLSVNGIERVPDKSTIFVSNHFTRLETIVLPYVIYSNLDLMPRSLTAHEVVEAFPEGLLEGLGSVSTRLKDRDNLVAKSLLSGENWIIFPEGRMVKDRDVIDDGRFLIHDGNMLHIRPPHTGAAVIALKAQMAAGLIRDFTDDYGIGTIFGLEELKDFNVKLVPVNITYYPIRILKTGLNRIVENIVQNLQKGEIPSRLSEELKVESSIFSPGVEITVNFGSPMRVPEYLESIEAKEVYPRSKDKKNPEFLSMITDLMNDYMAEIYKLTTLNPDHLIAWLLTTMTERGIMKEKWEDIERRVYLSALKVRESVDIYSNEILARDPESLIVAGERHLLDFIEMGEKGGLLGMEGADLIINEKEFKWPQKFENIRLLNTIKVISNEIEPLPHVTKLIDDTLTITDDELKGAVMREMVSGQEEEYLKDHTAFYLKGESKHKKFGMPKLFIGDRETGVLLIHGYMASPEEMRPLMDFLVKEGLTVYSVRLSGHGTSPYDLMTRTWEDWYYSVRIGYTILSQLVDNIYVCGFSMGGALAWLLAAQTPPRLKGVVSISAALKLVNKASLLAPAVDFADRLMKYLGFRKTPVEFIRNRPENEHINYFKNPVHGVDQLLELIDKVKGELKEVTVPALILQGGQDPTVDPESAEEYYNTISSDIKGLVGIDSPFHGIVYRGYDEIFQRILRFIRDPEDGVNPSHEWITFQG